MGKRKGHRGKAGGRLRFLRALKKEINTVKDFDPSQFWTEEAPTEGNCKPRPPPPRNLLVEIIDFRSRAAKADSSFCQKRILTRPTPMTFYTHKPIPKRILPRITSNITVNIKVHIRH
jgi:hypothetical protein